LKASYEGIKNEFSKYYPTLKQGVIYKCIFCALSVLLNTENTQIIHRKYTEAILKPEFFMFTFNLDYLTDSRLEIFYLNKKQ